MRGIEPGLDGSSLSVLESLEGWEVPTDMVFYLRHSGGGDFWRDVDEWDCYEFESSRQIEVNRVFIPLGTRRCNLGWGYRSLLR